MAKTMKPEQTIVYQNFKGAIYGGTPEQVKNLMTAFCQYAFDGIETPSVAPDIAMTFIQSVQNSYPHAFWLKSVIAHFGIQFNPLPMLLPYCNPIPNLLYYPHRRYASCRNSVLPYLSFFFSSN